MENQRMKFPRFPHLRSAKFAPPVAIFSLFFLTNFTGIFFSPVFAPSVSAAAHVQTIPADIPQSGDCDLDWIIFHAGERQGVVACDGAGDLSAALRLMATVAINSVASCAGKTWAEGHF